MHTGWYGLLGNTHREQQQSSQMRSTWIYCIFPVMLGMENLDMLNFVDQNVLLSQKRLEFSVYFADQTQGADRRI